MTARPSITRQAPAKKRNRSDEVVISSIAAPIGLPVWLDSRRPSSSAFSSMMSAILSRARLRVWGVVRDHDSNAVEAASTARSTSAPARRRHGRDDLAGRRVLDVQRLPRRRVDPAAADELLVRLDGVRGSRSQRPPSRADERTCRGSGCGREIVPLPGPDDQRRPSLATRRWVLVPFGGGRRKPGGRRVRAWIDPRSSSACPTASSSSDCSAAPSSSRRSASRRSPAPERPARRPCWSVPP